MTGLSFEDVEELAARLPGVEVATSYGTPALKVRGRLLARLREDGASLAVMRVEDVEQRFLMETRPDAFFKTDHYRGYDTVLVRLSRVEPEELQALLEQSWRRLASKRQVVAFEQQQPARGGEG